MAIKNFAKDERGGVLPMFAVCIGAIFATVGVAMDYSRAASARTGFQAAVDATSLMLAREAASLTEAQLTARAQALFAANFKNAETKGVTVRPTFTNAASGNRIRVEASGTIDTAIFRIFGVTQMDIGVSSEVVWGMRRLELALALDNTGSMASSGKLEALKTATHSLLETLQKASKKKDDIRVSIIPFTTFVNVDSKSNKKASWIDFSDWKAFDTVGVETGLTTEWINKRTGNKWTGCVTDRTQPYDAQDTPPSSGPDRRFPAVECVNPVPLIGLTSDWKKLGRKIDEMRPDGTTNVSIGLAWAWHSLTSGLPLNQGSAPATDLDKVIILLTDGENTENRWGTNTAAIDKRTEATCSNIKKEGIKLYTVRVIEGNATLLRGCATSPGQYYEVQQASQLNAVFKSIADSLATLRIAK